MRTAKQLSLILAIFLLIGTMGTGYILPLIEQSDSRANIRTTEDGLWWAVATVTSVGYGDHFPVTPAGRLLGIMLIVFGLSAFFALVSLVTVMLVQEEEQVHMKEILKRMEMLERKLERLTDKISLDKQSK